MYVNESSRVTGEDILPQSCPQFTRLRFGSVDPGGESDGDRRIY